VVGTIFETIFETMVEAVIETMVDYSCAKFFLNWRAFGAVKENRKRIRKNAAEIHTHHLKSQAAPGGPAIDDFTNARL
jgi:hypothetical protein